MNYIIAYTATLLAFLVLDGIWLGLIAKSSYEESIGQLMREQFHIWPWVVFYLSYGFAILYLVTLPHAESLHWWQPAISAAILGMAAYGAYNLTCYGILKDWPLSITLTDWAWGTCITTLSALSGWFAIRYFSS